MPNKIYIQSLYGKASDANSDGIQTEGSGDDVMVFPLQEDIRIDATSEIASWADVLPDLSIIDKLTAISTAEGSVNGGLLNLSNMVNAPRWQKTNPIEIVVTIGFYTIDNPYKNVYEPMKKIIGLSILSKENGRIVPPGLFLPAMASATASENQGDKAKGSSAKLVAIKIPGIIFMNLAMIVQAVPTFSKHITESGFPLWGTLELTIKGLYPAFEHFFNADVELGNSVNSPTKKGDVRANTQDVKR